MYVSVFVYLCPGDHLGANRQISIYVNSSYQSIAPQGNTVPNESTTCICFTTVKNSDTENVAVLLSHSSHGMQCRGWAWAWTWPYSHVYQPPECPYYTARWRRQSTTGGAAPLAVSLCQDVCLLTNCPCAALEAKSGGKAPSMLQFVVIVKQYVRRRRR